MDISCFYPPHPHIPHSRKHFPQLSSPSCRRTARCLSLPPRRSSLLIAAFLSVIAAPSHSSSLATAASWRIAAPCHSSPPPCSSSSLSPPRCRLFLLAWDKY
ncbi:hypothetical protein ACOSQ4_017550 [Xanthoceras sorbifolium]